jgi:hypothetical protein
VVCTSASASTCVCYLHLYHDLYLYLHDDSSVTLLCVNNSVLFEIHFPVPCLLINVGNVQFNNIPTNTYVKVYGNLRGGG